MIHKSVVIVVLIWLHEYTKNESSNRVHGVDVTRLYRQIEHFGFKMILFFFFFIMKSENLLSKV